MSSTAPEQPEPAKLSRKALQEQNFLREMDLTPVTMVNCLRSTHSDVMHVATTVLTFHQEGPRGGYGASINTGAMAAVLNPKKKKARVKPLASRRKHLALLKEHADFMSRLTAERTERLEIESWAASQLQVAVRKFLRRTDRRYGGAADDAVEPSQRRVDRFLASMATPGAAPADEIRALVSRSAALVEQKDADLDQLPPWERKDLARQRALARRRAREQLQLKAVMRVQAIARGFMGRKAMRYMRTLEQEERQHEAATYIQSHARVYTARAAEIRKYQMKVEKSVVIQALFRGYLDRIVVAVIHQRLDEYTRLVENAVRIQSSARTFLARKRVQAAQAHEAATLIQSILRTRHVQREIVHQQQEKAATLVQSLIRKRQAQAATMARREAAAAVKIQQAGRGLLARKEVQGKREEEQKEKEAEAAVKIQATVRSKQSRQAQEKKAQEQAAAKIQAVHRGNAARKEQAKREEGALAVQKVVRGGIDRRRVANEQKAAAKIQAVHRGNVVRKGDALAAKRAEKEEREQGAGEKPAEDTTAPPEDDSAKPIDEGVPTVTDEGEKDAEAAAAAKLQALARGNAARNELDAQNKAAMQVQKVVRGRQDRQTVATLREERRAALEAEVEAQDSQARSVKRRDIP